MAIGPIYSANPPDAGNTGVVAVSCRGSWITANDDAETAQSASDLLDPLLTDDTTVHPIKLGSNAAKCLVRAKYTKTATVLVSPVVRLYAIWGQAGGDGTFANDGTVRFARIDNADNNADGITLTLASSGTGMIQDATYAYSDFNTITPYDMLGADYLMVLVETAANVSTGAVAIEALLLN